ncbi:MAG: hypothetical protein AAFO81_14920 [Pseudomonadota bacterium]
MNPKFAHPRHWPVWALIGAQRLLVLLPWRLQRGFGAGIGWLALRLAKRRRDVAQRNIALAFTTLTHAERETLLRAHFRELGIGLLQIGMAWWASDARLSKWIDIQGLDHLRNRKPGQAALLVAGHFTTIDIIGRGLNLYASMDALYRPLGIELLDVFVRHGRKRCARVLIDKHNPKALIRRLRTESNIWLAVDQADTTASSVQAAFFGVPAPTSTTVTKLVAKHAPLVIPVSCVRTRTGRFKITIESPLSGFGADALNDATRLNAMVQRHVALAPDQYYWVHRRFKSADDKNPSVA